jgi:hypothetical protein
MPGPRPSPAQRAARQAFTERRKAIRARDLRYAPPHRTGDNLGGSCHRCGRLAPYDDLELVVDDVRDDVVWRVHRGFCDSVT